MQNSALPRDVVAPFLHSSHSLRHSRLVQYIHAFFIYFKVRVTLCEETCDQLVEDEVSTIAKFRAEVLSFAFAPPRFAASILKVAISVSLSLEKKKSNL